MKYYLILLLIVFSSCCRSFSQIPQPGDYITNNYINKFEGTWMWASGSDTVIIKLQKIKYLKVTNYFYEDLLLGCHTYIQNGSLVESSMSRFDSVILYNHRRNTLYCSNDPTGDTSKVTCYLTDISKNKMAKVNMQYIAGGVPQIQWELTALRDVIMEPTSYGFTLPRNIILTKQ